MSIKKMTITALFSAAIFAFPLVAGAADATFLNMSGVVKGKTTCRYTSSDGTKKSTMVVALTNGTLTKSNGTEAIIFDNVNNTARLNLTLNFVDSANVPAEVGVYSDSLLQSKSTLSGPAWVHVYYPSSAYVGTHAGKGKQYFIYSAARVIGAGRNDRGSDTTGKVIIKASGVTAGEAGFWNYSSDGAGSVSYPSTVYQDGKMTVPAMNFAFKAYTTAPK